MTVAVQWRDGAIGRPPAPRCRVLDPVVAAQIAAMLTGRTDEALNARFGISYNTWRKIEAGLPIRASVAKRLEQRVCKI